MYKMSISIPVVNESLNSLPMYADNGYNSGCDVKAFLNDLNEKYLFDAELVYDEEYDEENNVVNTVAIEELVIYPGGRALIPTGLHVAIPEGYEIQVRPRSGWALKEGVTVLNTPGTIDASYRGDIGVIVINHSQDPVFIKEGDKIAQLVLTKVEQIEWREVSELDETKRGENGYMSTGK